MLEKHVSDKDEAAESVVSPITPVDSISPVGSTSPISPNNQASDADEGEDMKIDKDVEKTGQTGYGLNQVDQDQADNGKANNELGDGEQIDYEQPDNDSGRKHNDKLHEDGAETLVNNKNNEKEILNTKHSVQNSPSKNKGTQGDDDDSSDVSNEETQGINTTSTDKIGSLDMEPTTAEITENLSLKEDGDTSFEKAQGNGEFPEKFAAHSRNNSLGDSDFMNITEISNLSVDLTGDEEAIIDDILQNAGDGELLAAKDQKETSGTFWGNRICSIC